MVISQKQLALVSVTEDHILVGIWFNICLQPFVNFNHLLALGLVLIKYHMTQIILLSSQDLDGSLKTIFNSIYNLQ